MNVKLLTLPDRTHIQHYSNLSGIISGMSLMIMITFVIDSHKSCIDRSHKVRHRTVFQSFSSTSVFPQSLTAPKASFRALHFRKPVSEVFEERQSEIQA